MYGHIMAPRRISTPHDLGAAVRDARTAAQLTQVELAERANVSREWLIGLERGTRPRAELTKILSVLAALDQPLMLGREEAAEVQEEGEPARDGAPMTTAEVTRRAIEHSRRPMGTAALGTNAVAYALGAGRTVSALDLDKMAAIMPRPDLSALLPKTALSSILSRTDIASFLPKTDLSALLPKTDYSTLMPQPSPAIMRLVGELGAMRESDQDSAERDDDRNDVGSDVIAEQDDDEHSAADMAEEADGPQSQDGPW